MTRQLPSTFSTPMTQLAAGARLAFVRPLVICVLAGALAVAVRWVEITTRIGEGWLDLGPDEARAFLGTLAGAMVTATIVVFWVRGLLVSSHATRMPNRILSDYLNDRYQQWVMGSMVGVFTFAVVGLAAVSAGGEAAREAPAALTVALAGVGSVAALLTIIQSIDSGVRSMHEHRVMREITERAFRVIERDYPERAELDVEEPTRWPDGEVHDLESDRIGWLRSIDTDRIMEALAPGTTCWVTTRVGEFASLATVLCRVASDGGDADTDLEAVQRAFEVGETRDPEGDLALAVRNLVDVAVGSLADRSDPTTGREAIAHLGAVLRPVVLWDGPPRRILGDHGRMIVWHGEPEYARHLHECFEDLSRAATDPTTARGLLSTLDDLIRVAEREGRDERAQVLRGEAAFLTERLRHDGLSERELRWVEERRSALPLPVGVRGRVRSGGGG